MPSALTLPTVPSARPRKGPEAAVVHSAEFELLLACCAHTWCHERVREVLEGPLDWDRFSQLARNHGVVPHLYRSLSSSGTAPPEALQLLQQVDESNARKALWLSRELLRILNHLEGNGIDTLPYKGPVLGEILYGNVALRQFSDLDLLIRATDLARAKAALLELGYKPALELTRRQERFHVESGYEDTFDGALGSNVLELQWRIVPRFYSIDTDIDDLFDRAMVVSLGGRSVRTICAEDLMLVLCVHAAKHGWAQLSWLCDIAKLTPSLDWVVVQEQARRLGIERIVAVTFFLAHRLLGTPLPQPVQERIRNDGAVEQVTERILPVVARGAEYDTESIAYFRLMLNARELWKDRLRFVWRLALTPSVGEWTAIRLPDLLFPMYRVVRLARLAHRIVHSVV